MRSALALTVIILLAGTMVPTGVPQTEGPAPAATEPSTAGAPDAERPRVDEYGGVMTEGAWRIGPGDPCNAPACGSTREALGPEVSLRMEIPPEARAVVFEFAYHPQSDLSHMRFTARCEGAACSYQDAPGTYQRVHLDRDVLDAVGITLDGLWELDMRQAPPTTGPVPAVGVAVGVDQHFALYVSTFVDGPAPDGYTAR